MGWMNSNPDIGVPEYDAVRVQRIFLANEFDSVNALRFVLLVTFFHIAPFISFLSLPSQFCRFF